MQSSAWAEFKQTEGFSVTKLDLWAGNELIGQANLLGYQGSGLITCPHGPVLPWDEPEVCRKALRSLCEYVREGHAVLLRIEPMLHAPKPAILRNWVKAPTEISPRNTLVVELGGSESELQSRMHSKARYNIRVAERQGVSVSSHTDVAAMLRFFALFEETAQRNGFFSEPRSFFLNLGSSLFENGMARVLIASRDGVDLAAMILISYGDTATYLYGGSSASGRRFMPNHAMHWQAMRLARESGCLKYDLYGCDPVGHPGHLYAGITRFKAQWGGNPVDRVGALDAIFYDHLADSIVSRFPT